MKVNREHVVGLVCLAVAAAVLLVTPGFPEGQAGVNLTGPAFFPNIMAYLLILLGAAQILAGVRKARARKEEPKDPASRSAALRMGGFFVLIAGFVAFFEPLGFLPTTLIFLFLLMLLFGMSPGRSALFSAFYTLIIFLLFGQLFMIGLPAGILGFLGI